jgi:hypothetical protein
VRDHAPARRDAINLVRAPVLALPQTEQERARDLRGMPLTTDDRDLQDVF